MKILPTEHNGLEYEFRLLEKVRVIQVLKAGELTYEIKGGPSGFFCNCPGAKYHKKCWHTSMVPALLTMPSCTEPWCGWAEDAGRMSYG